MEFLSTNRVGLAVDNALEQISLESCVAWLARSGEMEHLVSRHLAEVLTQAIKERRLRQMKSERLVLLLEAGTAHLDTSCDCHRCGWYPVRQSEVCSAIVEFLRSMRRQALRKLLRIAIRTPCPLECLRGECACHGVIRMSGESPICAERKDYVGTEPANSRHQLADNFEEGSTVESAVGMVQHLAVADSQELA